jgi:hypothetical protein
MTNSTTGPADAPWNPTSQELTWMEGQLAGEFPHLSVAVTMRARTIYVDALPR